MSIINRNHAAEPANSRAVKWDETLSAFTYSKNVSGQWQNVAVNNPFAIDVWCAMHGYELWADGDDGKRTRSALLVAVTEPLPVAPPKATPIYAVPVFSTELGGQRELIIKGKNVTDALADLFDVLESELDAANPHVPVVAVKIQTNPFGSKPGFEPVDFVKRPTHWAAPIAQLG